MLHDDDRAPDLAALILDRARRTPAAIAVTDGSLDVTFAEFVDRASRLAAHLTGLGVGPEVRVGVLLDRSVDQLVALAAVLISGGAYVPLDPSYPAARIAYMLDDVRAPVVIGHRAPLEAMGVGAHASTVCLDRDAARIAACEPMPPHPAEPGHLAYVVYTSGSTGRPKGAMNTRAGLVNRLLWMQHHYRMSPEDVVLQKTPVGFDVSVGESLWGLVAGARTVVAEPGGHRDPDRLAGLVRRHGVTVAHFVPSMLSVFLDVADPAGCGSLRQVVAGGEALSPGLVRRFFASGLGAELDNIYGPAETAIDVTHWRCRPDTDEAAVPIGTAVPLTDTHVLDDRGTPVAPGRTGELYIGGVQVGRGYQGRPELTAEKFVPDPFSGVPGARLYRTGDRVRLRTDGALEFLNRLDHQVKVRGVRIETGEIEALLADVPGVRAAAVAARGAGDSAHLAAYVVGDVPERVLRERLAAVLPEIMLPTAYVSLEALPLSPNGKLDRSALPRAEAGVHDGANGPRGTTEHAVAAVWGEVLDLATVARDADFIALGGTSLHAARIVSRLRARHGAGLTMSEFFAAGTVAGTAAVLDRSEAAHSVVPRSADAPLVPSLAQRRLWFLDHLNETAGTSYNIPVVTRVRGPLDIAALTSALGDVVARHEQLRTSFSFADGDLRARCDGGLPTVEVVDLTDRPQEAARLVADLTAVHLDLGRAPLLRATVLRLGGDEHVIVLVIHHIVSDGWTVDLLDRDLATAYAARIAGRSPEFAPATRTYRDFAQWGRENTGDLTPWRAMLRDAPVVLEIPADRPRPPVRSHRGRRISVEARGLLATVLGAAARTRTTPYAVCAAALGVLLRDLVGVDDLLIASPTSGRPDPGLEDVVGYFANTVPVRLRPDGGTFGEFATAVHHTTLEALEHQYVPFERLAREFAREGDLSRSPLTQVALAYQGRRRPNAALAGLAVEPLPADTGTAKFDVTVEITEIGEGDLEVTLEYDSALFDPERAEGLLRRYVDLLDTGAGRPEVALDELVGDARPGRPGAGRTGLRCLHEIFAEVAAAVPDRVAVVDGRRSMSYAELDVAANRLAHRLVALGAGPERLVGLCTERTVDLVVAVLAVLKSGAGYLPLDPTHPVSRSTFALDDAGCDLVVTDDEHAEALAAPGRRVVRLTDVSPDAPGTAPEVDVRPGNVAYVIYTSGSTGRPKGVVVPHANAVRLFEATADDHGFGPDDVWTLFHSIAFDFSVWELWGALLHGGRLVVVGHLTSRDPAAFLELLRAEGVTVLNQTPTAFKHLAAAAESAGSPPLALRLVVFGGEALEPAALRPWVRSYGTARPRLVNMYGITETTVHVTVRPLDLADLDAAVSPIGGPFGEVRVHILDEQLREVAAGVEGEMYVGGPGVSRCYLGRPALTAERFLPDPFGGPGDRLYRTGDLAVRLAGGELVFRGRSDSQVQLHGFRIELGEIERALLDRTGVRAAVCLLREDVPGQPRLVAYVVTAEQDLPDLRTLLAERLPAHMLPSAIVRCDALPLTANGKLDRDALPPPDAPRSGTADDGTAEDRADAPRSETERALARIWAAELGIGSPGLHDNFFAVGGDSIIAIRVGIAARAQGLPVTVERVFLHATIGELAAECDRLGDADVAPPSASVHVDERMLPDDVEDAYPTAAMQLGILYECELADDRPELYHDLASVRLRGRFDADGLRRALDAMTERHEILRTSFDLGRYGQPMQLVHRRARIPLVVDQLTGHDADAELRAWWEREVANPFDIGTAPLLRCHVLPRGPEEFQVSIALHHVVLDGWSVAQLMTDLLQAYDTALAGGEVVGRQAPASRYRDFVAAERAAVESPRTRAFWTGVVERLPDPKLPELPGDAGSYRAELPTELDTRLREVAASIGTPQKSLYLAAHFWALSQLTGEPVVASGVQVNGRLDEAGSDRLLGVLLNVPPLVADVSGQTWAGLARVAFDAERAAQPHRRFPVGQIRQLSDGMLYQVAFNFVDFHNLDDVKKLTRVEVVDWWFADEHSVWMRVQFSRSRATGARLLDVTTGVNAEHLAGTAQRLGALVRDALDLIAADVQAPCPPAHPDVP
ncbi:amino acid adenylation domain-containing protein [Kitasatospora sp. NPDC017646]|uniref:amino acid adenylation domain-containing protein n=1 Tax=Kitasatospora sp. NPDC017646 TaxID=3364024 RepID=UPI0037AECAA6